MDFKISELHPETILMADNMHTDSTEYVLDSTDFSNMQKFTLMPEFEGKHNITNKISAQCNKKFHKASNVGTKSSEAKKPNSIFKIEPPSLSKCLFSKNQSFMKNVPSRRFECYKCKKPFPSFSEVVTHLKLLHNACASQNCSKISNFKMHSTACVNRGLGCAICDEKFEDKNLLLKHFNEHINVAFYACEVCREGFQERKDLQKHFFQNHNKFLSLPSAPTLAKTMYQKCDHCLKYFKLFDEFEQHVSTCGSSTYACHVCKVSFVSLAAVEEHKGTEHNSEQALKGYEALKHGKRYFCGICYLGFTKGSILKEHVNTHGMTTKYICDVCSISYSSDNDLQEHYLQHIEEHYVLHDVISQHSCSSCQKTFKTQKELKDHTMSRSCKKDSSKASHIKNFSESSSDKENSAVSENTLESMADIPLDFSNIPVYVLKVGEDLLNCDDSECIVVMDLTSLFVLQRGICASESRMPDVVNSEVYDESEVVDASLLESHMLQILSPIGEENLAILADTIDQSYLEQNEETTSNVETVVLGMGESEPDSVNCMSLEEAAEALLNCQPLSVEKQGSPDNNNENYEFLVYDNSNNTANSYEVDNEESPDKILVRESNVDFIDEYVENPHAVNNEAVLKSDIVAQDVGLYICNICKEVFSEKAPLYMHVKESHTGNDCYRCGSSFASDKELKDHEKLCHPTAVQCDLCDMCFTKEQLLQKHKQMAHGEKCFLCSICNKSYVLKDEYEIHMMLHNGQTPPTKCEECGKVYASVSSYTRHKDTHETKSPSKKYVCTICDKVFAAQSPLKTHLATHMRKSPYNFECPKCRMYFPPKVLAKHIETHINIVS